MELWILSRIGFSIGVITQWRVMASRAPLCHEIFNLPVYMMERDLLLEDLLHRKFSAEELALCGILVIT